MGRGPARDNPGISANEEPETPDTAEHRSAGERCSAPRPSGCRHRCRRPGNGLRRVLRRVRARGRRDRSERAAVGIQRARQADMARRFPVTVRVGIHSGRQTLTDVGHIGLAVHTTARVCSAAQGGQIVVSRESRAAVGRSAPEGIRFRSLGRHRLPGLPDAVALFQVQAKGPVRRLSQAPNRSPRRPPRGAQVPRPPSHLRSGDGRAPRRRHGR